MTQHRLDLQLSEDAWQGDAQYTIAVDGVQIGGVRTETALHGAGSSEAVALVGAWNDGAHTVAVSFLNDAWGGTNATDRNLYVDGATYDGVAVSGPPVELYCTGTASFTTPASGPASTTPVTLHLSEDAWQGDAQYTVAIDGVATTSGTETVSHSSGGSQAIQLAPILAPGTHDVALSFTNDAWGGTDSTDRNLYVNGISVGGTAELSGQYEFYSNGTAHFTVVTPSSAPPPPAGFYVAASGSDSADGSAAHPFASLARATQAMESSSLHTTYVEGSGTLSMSGPLNLQAADSGFTIAEASGATAVISATGGAQTLFMMNGVSGFTFSGLTLENTAAGSAAIEMSGSSSNTISGDTFLSLGGIGVEMHDGSNNNVVTNSTFNGIGGSGTNTGAVYTHGANGTQITHNLIENAGGAAISLSDFYGPGTTGTQNIGDTVAFNDIEGFDISPDPNYPAEDSGGIYILGRSIADTQTTVNMNFIQGTGNTSQHSVGLYLDDNTSGVTATNNIVVGSGSDAFEIHGGSNNTLRNNIFDLGTGTTSAGLFQANPSNEPNPSPSQNDVVTGNVFQTESTAPRNPLFANYGGGSPAVGGNDFWATTGAPLNAGAGQSYVGPNFQPGYATSGDGIGFVLVDRTQMGLQH